MSQDRKDPPIARRQEAAAQARRRARSREAQAARKREPGPGAGGNLPGERSGVAVRARQGAGLTRAMAPGGAWTATADRCRPRPPCSRCRLRRRTAEGDRRTEHEAATGRWIGERLAALLGFGYGGVHSQDVSYDAPPFFVPDTTLLCRRRGVGHPRAAAPVRWRGAARVRGDQVDHPSRWSKARASCRKAGRVRWAMRWTKSPCPASRRSASTTSRARPGTCSTAACRRASSVPTASAGSASPSPPTEDARCRLAHLDANCLERIGAVIELNLKPVKTYSVGTVSRGRTASPISARSGSRAITMACPSTAVRRCLPARRTRRSAAHRWTTKPSARVRAARSRYDAEASRAYPAFFASRRNYDVALGVDQGAAAYGRARTVMAHRRRDAGGDPRAGGDAPGPSLRRVALHARGVRDESTRLRARTCTSAAMDPAVGPMTKYAMLDAQEDAHGR